MRLEIGFRVTSPPCWTPRNPSGPIGTFRHHGLRKICAAIRVSGWVSARSSTYNPRSFGLFWGGTRAAFAPGGLPCPVQLHGFPACTISAAQYRTPFAPIMAGATSKSSSNCSPGRRINCSRPCQPSPLVPHDWLSAMPWLPSSKEYRRAVMSQKCANGYAPKRTPRPANIYGI